MMKKVLIKNAKIVNEGKITEGDVFIEDGIIREIAETISANLQMFRFLMLKEAIYCRE